MNSPHNAGRILHPALILLAALAAGLGLWLGLRGPSPSVPTLQAGLLYPVPRTLGDFRLTRPDGTALTLADWRGHWTLVFLGYTNCPDVCPTTLATLREVWTKLGDGPLRQHVRVDFISVDPKRDTPDQLTRYAAFFSPDFIAATGSDEELIRLSRSLGLLFVRQDEGKGSYAVDHSASIVIIDPDGRLAGLFRPPLDAGKIAADLATLAGTR